MVPRLGPSHRDRRVPLLRDYDKTTLVKAENALTYVVLSVPEKWRRPQHPKHNGLRQAQSNTAARAAAAALQIPINSEPGPAWLASDRTRPTGRGGAGWNRKWGGAARSGVARQRLKSGYYRGGVRQCGSK